MEFMPGLRHGSPGYSNMRLSALFLLLLLAFPSCASGSGFIGPGSASTIHSAAEALRAADDAPCVLEGRIIAKIRGRKNRYLFEDASGQIIVEIRRKAFGSLTITPASLVRIDGEVDVSDKYPNEIEAESLTVLR